MAPRFDPNKSTAMKSYDGEHVFHYCVTPPEKRPHFTIDDCPKEHRVYDNLNTYRRSGGSQSPAKFHCDVERPTRSEYFTNRKPKKQNGGGRPVMPLVFFDGKKILAVPSCNELRDVYKRRMHPRSLASIKHVGYYRFRDGAVVWAEGQPTPPDVVAMQRKGGLLSRAIEMNAKEA